MNRRPGRKPGFCSNVHGANTRTYHMGRMKLQSGVCVKNFSQKESPSVTSSNCRVSIVLPTGEEVVRHIYLWDENAVLYWCYYMLL